MSAESGGSQGGTVSGLECIKTKAFYSSWLLKRSSCMYALLEERPVTLEITLIESKTEETRRTLRRLQLALSWLLYVKVLNIPCSHNLCTKKSIQVGCMWCIVYLRCISAMKQVFASDPAKFKSVLQGKKPLLFDVYDTIRI